MANDRLLRKIARQADAPAQAAPPEDTGAPKASAPRNHLPAHGHRKVTMNFRGEVWLGVEELVEEAGVPTVCIVEALIERYLASPAFRRRINAEALEVARARRVLARKGRQP